MSDEKEARGYLQALASKMTEELEGLKSSGYATIPRVCCTKELTIYNDFAVCSDQFKLVLNLTHLASFSFMTGMNFDYLYM